MRVFLTLLVTFITLSVSGAAAAGPYDRAESYDRAGWYVGLGAGWATDLFENEVEKFVEDVAGQPASIDIAQSWSINAVGGYRLFSFLALELEYEYVNDFEIEGSIEAGPVGDLVGTVDLSAHIITANVKAIVPFWRVQPYGLVGLGVATFSADLSSNVEPPQNEVAALQAFTDESGFAARLGAGVDVYLTEHWLLTGGVSAILTADKISSNIVPSEDLSPLHLLTFSGQIQYRF